MPTPSLILSTLLVCFCAGSSASAVMQDPPPGPQVHSAPVPSLTVTGTGVVEVKPDLATVIVGATAQEKEAGAAQSAVNQIMNAAIDAIVNDVGIEKSMIQTSGLELYPVYSQPQPRRDGTMDEPRITGYRASNTIRVRVREMNRVGDVIDAAVSEGANQLMGISFELEDDSKQRLDALARAVEQARQKARVIAQVMGVRLEGPLDVREASAQPIVPYMETAALGRMAADTSAPVMPGQVRVEATVTIRYGISGTRSE